MPAVYFAATHVKIASGATTSSEADLRGLRLIGIGLPAMTGATVSYTAAERSGSDLGWPSAVFTAVSFDPGTGTSTAVTTAAGGTAGTHFINATAQIANCVLKVVSASSEAADRDLILYVAPMG